MAYGTVWEKKDSSTLLVVNNSKEIVWCLFDFFSFSFSTAAVRPSPFDSRHSSSNSTATHVFLCGYESHPLTRTTASSTSYVIGNRQNF